MENIPKIVRARLQRPALSAAVPHPDSDLLTAFAEHSLAAGERDHVLEHLARCGECRDVVALALPATESAALASYAPARKGWLSLPVLRWGVVAAGVALVASFSILQYRQRRPEKTLVATSLMSHDQASDTAAQSALQPPTAAPAAADSQMVARQSEARKQVVMEKTEKKMAKTSAVPAAVQGAPVINQPAPAVTIPAQPQPMRRSNTAGAIHGSAGFGFAPGIGRSSTVVEVTPPSDAEPAPPDQLQALSKAKPASPQSSAAMVPAPLLHNESTLMRMKGVAPRWTISDRGALQRSLDGGATWQDVDIAVNNSAIANLVRLPQSGMSTSATVEASSASAEVQSKTQTETQAERKAEAKSEPSFAAKPAVNNAAKPAAQSSAPARIKSQDDVPVPLQRPIFRAVSVSSNAAEVWAGGSGGALYHTIDAGNHWTLVIPSDAGLVLAGDVIGIQFSNPRNGIVTTSTAEVWTTLDAGQSWHKQQ